MSLFNHNTAARIQRYLPGFGGGRNIFVDSTGSDSTGDGSRQFPYATISRAFQDVRNGRNDVVYLLSLGALPGSPSTQEFTILGKNSWAMVGIGPNLLGRPTGAGMRTITAITRIDDETIEVTSTAHGLAVGDPVFFRGVAQTSTNRINGPGVVTTVPGANTARVRVQAATAAAGQPFSGGATGNLTETGMRIDNCQDFLVANVNFGVSAFTANGWAGLVVDSSDFTGGSARGLFLNCLFNNASLGFLRPPSVENITFGGFGFLVEGCQFSPTVVPSFSPLVDFSQLYLAGGQNWVVNENIFANLTTNGFVILDPQYPGAIRHSGAPGLGAVIVNNLFSTAIPQDQRVFADAASDVTNVFYRRNFYPAGSTPPEPLDAAGLVEDLEPADFIGQEFLNTHSDLIWRQPTETALAGGLDTMGGLLGRQAYGGSVYIDVAGGASGTTPGVNGTPDNPVDNVSDARTIADQLGLRSYVLTGPVTISTDHVGWTFRGRTNPGNDVLTLSGGPDVDGSNFTRLTLTGQSNGEIVAVESILDALTDVHGIFLTSLFRNTVAMPSSGSLNLLALLCAALPAATVDLNGGSHLLGGASLAGVWAVTNCTTGVVGLSFAGGQLTLAASCTGGIANIGGIAVVTDASAGTAVTINALSRPVIADDVWDEASADHLLAGSTGEALVNDPTAADVADAVWDELLAGHGVAGSFGEAVSELINGLVARGRIDITTDPWTEVRYVRATGGPPDTVVYETYELYDQDGAAINGDDSTGNNPLADPTRIIAERRRV